MARTKGTRYESFGVERITHKARQITTSVGVAEWDRFVRNIDGEFEYKLGKVPVGYAHRPDLISNIFYGTPSLWWLLLVVNKISDPFEGLNVGDQIKIPKIN